MIRFYLGKIVLTKVCRTDLEEMKNILEEIGMVIA